MEGRRDMKGEKEGVEEERRKERKKVLKEGKNNNKELLFKKCKKIFFKCLWLQTAQASFAGLLAAANSGGLTQLFSVWPVLRQPLAQLSRGPRTHRFTHSPSSGLWVYMWDHLWFALSSVPVVSSLSLSLVLWIWAHCPLHPGGSTRRGGFVERRLELLLQGISQSAPPVSFPFWENPSAQSCRSIQGRACLLTQPTSPARLGIVWVKVPHSPTLNPPQPAPTVSVCLPLCPYSPPCDFKQPSLSWCCSSLVWQGRELLTWGSPRSPVAGQRVWVWGSSHTGPGAGPRDIFVLKQSPYHLFFQCPLYFLVSYLHKHWGTVGCLLYSSVDWLGVSPVCRGK